MSTPKAFAYFQSKYNSDVFSKSRVESSGVTSPTHLGGIPTSPSPPQEHPSQEQSVCGRNQRGATSSNQAPFGALWARVGWMPPRQLLNPRGQDRQSVSISIYNLCGGLCDLAT